MINTIVSAVLQILAFSLIPFVVFLVKRKTPRGFFQYVGLYGSNAKANSAALLVSLVISIPSLILVFASSDLRATMTNPESITGTIRQLGLGAEAIFTIVVIAIFKTAFAEELLFRGFLAKRLISMTSYRTGNVIQAFIFGIIHLGIFLSLTNSVLFLTMIFLVSAVGAYLNAYINEKLANGSIVPSWIAHALANILSYSVIGFLL